MNVDLRSLIEDAELGARLGWLAKGALFVVIGLLGLDIARRGFSSDDADQTGALVAIADAPVGRALVTMVSIGLFLFAIFQLWSAVVDDHDSLFDLGRRIGIAGLGVSYGLVAISGIQIVLGGSTSAQSGQEGATSPETIASFLLSAPGGRVALSLLGAGTIAIGGYHLWKGLSLRFVDDIKSASIDERARMPLIALGVAGFIARSLMLGIAGWLLVSAAWMFNADEAAGLDESLRTLASAPFGRTLLAAASLGLISAGIYDAVTFRRQRLE